MKKIYATGVFVLAAIALLGVRRAAVVAAQQSRREVSPLQLEEEIPVPTITGRIDHFTADAKRRLIIFSALGNNSVEVINVFEGRVVHSIKGLNEPQGVLYVPGYDKIFVANGGNGSVNVYDAKTYLLRKTIKLGADPDNLRWDETSKRVFVGYGGDGTGAIAMVDPSTETHVSSDFKTSGGHPESFQIEKHGSRIFVNVPDDGPMIEVIDRKTGKLTKWEFNGARVNYPMTLDEENHRLFTVTRKPPLMIVFNTETGKEVTRLAAAGESDDAYFDSNRKRIYVIGAEGFISVFAEKDPDRYELIEKVPTTVGARTGYFFGSRDRLYLGVPAKGSEPAQVWTFEAED